MDGLFKKYVNHTVSYMKKECKFVVPCSFFAMTMSLCKLLQSCIKNEKANIQTEDKAKPYDLNKVEHLFNMCMVWAFGGCLTEKDGKDYRKDFSNWWRGATPILI